MSRNILILAAAAALSATPLMAQQGTPGQAKAVATAARDMAHAAPKKTVKRKHKKTAKHAKTSKSKASTTRTTNKPKP